MTRAPHPIRAALVALALAGCGAEQPAAQTQAQLAPGEELGWIYYDLTGVDAARSYNALGGALSVDHFGPGQYTAHIGGPTLVYGNVLVDAVGTDATRCKVTTFLTTMMAEVLIGIRCHTPGGALADSRFVLSYVAFLGGTAYAANGAYLVMNQPTGGVLDPNYMWGDSVTVSHDGMGAYTLTFATHTLADGNLQVTALGAGPDYCKLSAMGGGIARVRCFTIGGAAYDTRFTLRYTRGSISSHIELHESWQGDGAYFYVEQPFGPPRCYTPVAAYNFSLWKDTWNACVFSDPNKVCHQCDPNHLNCSVFIPGIYEITLPHLEVTGPPSPTGYLPFATAFGNGTEYCKPAGWGETGSDGWATVYCWNATGTFKVDSSFTFLYLTNSGPVC